MPYVNDGSALDQPFTRLDTLAEAAGPGPWRIPLVGTDGLRVVLLRWLPGYATVPHVHPGAEEIFFVVSGRASFTVGDLPEREVGPGELVLARRGTNHAIRVPGPEPLVLLAAVAPNEDRPDETIEKVTTST